MINGAAPLYAVTPTSSKTKAADQKGVFVGEGVEGSGDSCGGGDVSEEGQVDGGTGLNGCAGGGESSAQETDVIELVLGDLFLNSSRRTTETIVSVAYAYNFSDGGGIFDRLEEKVSYICAGDFEAKTWQMTRSDAIVSGEWPVGELRGAHDGPVEAALHNDPLHCGCVDDYTRKKHAAEEIGWRHDGILEQESC